MNALRIALASVLGCFGAVIIVCAIVPAASKHLRGNKVEVFVSNFEDYGLTPGLILLCTAVILSFLPRVKGNENQIPK